MIGRRRSYRPAPALVTASVPSPMALHRSALRNAMGPGFQVGVSDRVVTQAIRA